MSLSVEIAATRAAIAPSGGATHLRVTVTPPTNQTSDAGRRPVALMLVADRSGSMQEPAGGSSMEQSLPVAPPVPMPRPQPISTRLVQPPMPTPIPMYGPEHRTKISVLRDAAERLVDAMRDEDLLGLVSFSDVAQRDLPLAALGGGMRHTARQAIRAPASGCIDQSGGWVCGWPSSSSARKPCVHISAKCW